MFGAFIACSNRTREEDPLAVQHEVLGIPVTRSFTDCGSLKSYLRTVGSTMQVAVPVHGHTWRLRFRTPEELLCREVESGLVQNSGPQALDRLAELRSLDQYVLSVEMGEGAREDAVAAALFDPSKGGLEERFIQIVGDDTLLCRFAHMEALGKGPWERKLLLAFDRDTTAAERTILLTEVPGIVALQVRMPFPATVFPAHATAARRFLTPTSPTDS